MRRKDRKWSALTPGKWMGFSKLLPSILSICACGSANIASKGVPGTLKPFLRTLKSVFSTFSGKMMWSFLHIKTGNIPQKRQFGSWIRGQDENRRWVPPEVHRLEWETTACQKKGAAAKEKLAEISGHRNESQLMRAIVCLATFLYYIMSTVACEYCVCGEVLWWSADLDSDLPQAFSALNSTLVYTVSCPRTSLFKLLTLTYH